MKYRISHLLLVVAAIALVFAIASYWRTHQRIIDGLTYTRNDGESIRVSWGTPSGYSIHPKSTMRFSLGHQLETAATMPVLSNLDDVWMWDVQPDTQVTSLVNPRNNNSLDQMKRMLKLSKLGNGEGMTRVAAKNYLYLGFVVRSQEEVFALQSAVGDRENVSLTQDLHASCGTLYRLSPNVEQRLAQDPADAGEIARLRHDIPVMFELPSRRNRLPFDSMQVLYLDGHIEEIPIGDKFPATAEFIEAFTERQ